MTPVFKLCLRDRLRAALMAILCLSVAAIAITLFLAFTYQRSTLDIGGEEIISYHATLGTPVTIMVMICYIAPVLVFSPFKKRRSLDCFYSLPISRRGLAAAHYLTGLAVVTVPFTLSYLTNFLMLLRFASEFNLLPILGHYFLVLIFGAVIYSVFVFAFNQANTAADGVWFMILYSFVLGLVVSCIPSRIEAVYLSAGYGAIWSPVAGITSIITHIVEGTTVGDYGIDYSHAPVWYCIWVVLAAAATVSFFLTFGKRRAEKTEELSDSYLGYRTLIPVYAAAGMLSLHTAAIPYLWLVIEIIAATGYTIYRRGFHYKKSDLIVLGLLLIFLFV